MKLLRKQQQTYFVNHADKSQLAEIVGLTAPMSNSQCSIAITDIGVGGKVIKHKHNQSEETYVFTKGGCTMLINGNAVEVCEGDSVLIEIGDWHEILPCNSEVSFYAVTCPPYRMEDFIMEENN